MKISHATSPLAWNNKWPKSPITAHFRERLSVFWLEEWRVSKWGNGFRHMQHSYHIVQTLITSDVWDIVTFWQLHLHLVMGSTEMGLGLGAVFYSWPQVKFIFLNSFLYDAASRNQVYFGHILLINEYFSITYSSPGACFSFLKQIAHQRLHQSCRCVKEPRMQFGIRLSHSKRCFKNISLHLIIFPLFQGEPIIHNINTFT